MDSSSQSILARAVLTVLRPLLRVLIRNEVSHAQFSELARQAYVEVAYDHFSLPNRKMTYARAAVLTGLSRKEVVRLNAQRTAEVQLKQSTPNRALRVINGWMNDAEFLTAEGEPAVLPIQGAERSFSALVARYSGDITLGAVLDELERVGIVSRSDNDRVKLESQGYIPKDSELQKVQILATCAADLMSTAVHNLEDEKGDARFQRQLVYDNVPADVATDFRRIGEKKAMELLVELNQLLDSANRNHVPANTDKSSRVGMGVYYFENTNKPGTEKDEDQA